jgi:hypothetical protein
VASRLAPLGFAFAMVACAGANSASGTVAGKSWDGAVKKATYCDHCAGGTLVTVVFQRGEDLGTLVLEFENCISNHDEPFGKSGARLSFFEHPNGARVEASSGTLRLDVCTEKELRGRFEAVLSDGGKVSARLDTALEFDAGYD